jgi:hypothetical protein
MFPKFCKQKAELKKNGKVAFVCCKQKTEMANFCLFAANGNGKWKFVFLGRQTTNIIDDCCFSKCAHLWYIYFLKQRQLNYFMLMADLVGNILISLSVTVVFSYIVVELQI